MCEHKLSSIGNLVASGPFKLRCRVCDRLVYREHPLGVLPLNALTLDGIGLLLVVVFFSVLAFLPWAVAAFAVLCGALYMLDIKRQPLKEFTEEHSHKEKKVDFKTLLLLGTFFIVSLAVYFYEA